MKKIYLFLLTFALLLLVSPNTVFAEVILSVTGNGEGTENTVTVEAPSQTTVVQGNDMHEENKVISDAVSGENKAEDNSQNVQIETGDATAQSQVENKEINGNVAVSDGCNGCPELSGKIEVSENGAGSQNTINTQSESTISISQSNNASINNYLENKAITGENEALDNSGGVIIQTGDVFDSQIILNRKINFDYALLKLDRGPFETIIEGNGADTVNRINFLKLENIDYENENVANIFNIVKDVAQSGGNKAEGNACDVSIITGDVSKALIIKNEKINYSMFTLVCCPEETPPPVVPPPVNPPPVTPPPSVTPSNGNGGVGGVSENGDSESEGEVSPGQIQPAEILPVTGSFWLFLFIIGNILAFFFGWYLRLRAGNSPGVSI